MPTNDDWARALLGFKQYLVDAGRRPGTYRTHACYLRRLADDTQLGPWSVSAADLTGWLASQQQWTADTRLSVVAAIRSFYGWAYRSGRCTSNPSAAAFPARTGTARVAHGQDLPDTWRDLVERYAEYLAAAGRRPQTVRQARMHVGMFARQQPDGPGSVSERNCLAYLGSQAWAPETRKSARSALRGFFGWAHSRGGFENDPTAQLPSVTVPAGVPHPVPNAVFEDALGHADDKTRLMLLLAAYAGLRRAEIARVYPARDISDGCLHVEGKGGRRRLVPLHPLLLGEIELELGRRRAGQVGTGFRYRNAASGESYLFPGQQPGTCTTPSAIGDAVSPLLGEHYTTHGLRHRFATRAYAATRDIRAVQELLGHSKPETTARYTAVPDGALRAAVMGA